jgi:hypothetical protein
MKNVSDSSEAVWASTLRKKERGWPPKRWNSSGPKIEQVKILKPVVDDDDNEKDEDE